MKRLSILMLVMLLGVASLWARPGYSKPVDVLQPDGTTVTLLMRGDEFQSFMTTVDGYTVIKGDDGFYRYAVKEGNQLKASPFIAKNAEQRKADEQAFLTGTKKMICAAMSEEGKQWKEQVSKMYSATYENMQGGQRRAITPGAISERINYSKFKGLVVLVNWNDRSFNISEPVSFYQKLTNQENYTDDSKTVYPYNVKGSARDYFRDNSMGIFDPTFDVIGPVTINYSCEYPYPKDAQGNVTSGWTTRMNNILKAVLAQANELVDFNDYDLNSDGYIDMVYIIFAGYGSYVQGNNVKLIWPHANDYTGYSDYAGFPRYDNKRFGRYACSVEIQDSESYAQYHAYPDGIGTICHEFSHVLGLADHYDTDYDENGNAVTPGLYDVMDNGADNNQGLSPVGYSAFERYILGFADNTVTNLDVAGNYSLEPLNTSNTAYFVKTAKNGEVFYLENRQKQGWDESLPGHGLIVWRIDTSNKSKFTSNKVNISPGTECLQVLGLKPVTEIDLTAATNEVWGSKSPALDLYDITEENGIITFEAGKDLYSVTTEDFEATPLTTADATGVAGKFCTWDLANAVVTSTTETLGTGSHMVQFSRNGTLTSSALEKGLRTLQFKVQNGSQKVRFQVSTSTDGTNWTLLESTEIAKNKEAELNYRDIPAGSRIRFTLLGTSNSAVCYVDDLNVTFKKSSTAIEGIQATSAKNGNGVAYNLAGQRVGQGYKGLIIKDGQKMIVK